MVNEKCYICNAEESPDSDVELRPYGKGGAWVCYDCAMKPEHKAITEQQFQAQFEAAEKHSRVVAIGDKTGPFPLRSLGNELRDEMQQFGTPNEEH